ncbi:MAG: alkaline phosphatase [Ruminococcaceae bacterium]|nr:alkaline phosphatase [Oscillospiraceae bacterium]
MKKFLAIILSLFLVLSFSACGEKQAENGEESKVSLKEQLQGVINSEFETPKNIIFIIGDGMGPNDITLAEEHADGVYEFGLALNLIKNHGLATTYSASDEVTDSAASGTALATGVKTNNGYIGKDTKGNDIINMAEIARAAGKKVGIITDEVISGATPTAFTVHNISRSNTAELVNSMIEFKPDVLMGKDYNSVFMTLGEEEREIFENDYVVAKKFIGFKGAMDSDPNCKKAFLGFLSGYSSIASDELSLCAELAFERLKNDKGFFLMIESSGTDKYGHSNDIKGKLNSVVTLDRTVAAALKFMEKNPDTLLIITSDHETGGVKLPDQDTKYLSDLLTVTSHTATPVRVFGVGKGTEYFKDKTVDNTDIAKFVISAITGQ